MSFPASSRPRPARAALPQRTGARARAAGVTKTLPPGADGTKKLLRTWGEALVCIRYRRDATGLRRYTTVELVVDARTVLPPAWTQTRVGVRIEPDDRPLRLSILEAGGEWDDGERLWWLDAPAALRLGLLDRAERWLRPPGSAPAPRSSGAG